MKAPVYWLFLTIALVSCGQEPNKFSEEYPMSHAFDLAPDSPLTHIVRPQLNQHPQSHSGFHLIQDGPNAFAARALLADKASSSIDIQYYMYSDDTAGRILSQKLIDAADRGVRVRLLIDDLGARMNNSWLLSLAHHTNIQVRVFNPIEGRSGFLNRAAQALNIGRINRRMHNKLLVVDGVIMLTGGRNIADGYFTDAEVKFLDVDALCIGAIVKEASSKFDEYWNHSVTVPADKLALKEKDDHSLDEFRAYLARKEENKKGSALREALSQEQLTKKFTAGELNFHWGPATLYADSPGKAVEPEKIPPQEYPGYQLKKIVTECRNRILVTNPYLIPGDPGMALVRDLERNGVQIEILTNGLSSTDTAMAHGSYSQYREPLLRAGVRLWELKPTALRKGRLHWFSRGSQATLHAKTFVLDEQRSFIGSINLDSRSILLNTEIGILIENPEINDQLEAIFKKWTAPNKAWQVKLEEGGNIVWQRTDDNGENIVLDKDPNSTLWQRFLTGILAYLPIESQI